MACGERFTTFEIELSRYHSMLKRLRGLYKQAGSIVREMGSDRETQ